MEGSTKPYSGAGLERCTFSELTALILSASGPALDAIELYLADVQAANELAPDALAPEAVRFALARIGNLKGTLAYRRLELAAAAIEAEAYRLVDVAETHRATMLRELGDPDGKRQRGNAGAFAYVDGEIGGLLYALRAIGFGDVADRVGRRTDSLWEVACARP